MDLGSHFAAMWRHKWVVLVGCVVVATAVFFTTSSQRFEKKVYQASAQLGITPGTTATGQASIQDAAPFLAATYANLAKTAPLLASAAKRSGLGIDEETAAGRISATPSTSLGVVTLVATGPSPADADRLDAAMVTTLVAVVISQQSQALKAQLAPIQSEISRLTNELNSLPASAPQRGDLETELAALVSAETTQQLQAQNLLTVQSPAQVDSDPISPKPIRDALLALLTSLVVLAELSVAFEVVSDRLAPASLDEEIPRLTGLRVLAQIPRGEGPGQLEAFRMLRTSLLFGPSDKIGTIGVVSSQVGAGKTFVSINLATALADLKVPVALVDGDMRRPALDLRLKVPRVPGLSEVLFGEAELNEATRPHTTQGGGSLFVLPAGSAVADPPGLLSSQLRNRVFDKLSDFQTVIVDTPAESLFPDSAVIASHCDCVMVVVDAKSTKRRHLQGLIDHLNQVQAQPIGVVVNRAQASPKGAGATTPGSWTPECHGSAERHRGPSSHERFTELGGSERVVEELHAMWPEATIHVAIVDRSTLPPSLAGADVRPSFLQRLYRGGSMEGGVVARALLGGSKFVAKRVADWWGREARVMHPPVDLGRFTADATIEREPFFLITGRRVPYKRPEVAIAAARRANVQLVVAGEGCSKRLLEPWSGLGTGIELLGAVDDVTLVVLLRRCSALLFPGMEDFGIIPLGAPACGAPVIAFGRGGALDSVLDGLTGQLYTPELEEDEIEVLAHELKAFDPDRYDHQTTRRHAEGFSPEVFRAQIEGMVAELITGRPPRVQGNQR